MADTVYDVIVIGGGPGGYVAAIRAAQLGLKTACIEKRGALGGTCLNVGCIPSKALLHSSEKYIEATKHLAIHGVDVKEVTLNLGAMMGRKTKVVEGLTKGIELLFRKHKIDYIKGTGTLTKAPSSPSPGAVEVDGTSYNTKNIIIATGSTHVDLPSIKIDEKLIVSSTGALSLPKVPKHLVVIGGGYIGLEMGSVWRRLGAEVTVVEFLDRIVPGMDGEVGKAFHRLLERQGFKFRLGTKVTEAKTTKSGVTLSLVPATDGKEETLECDIVLVAVGRRPYTQGLGLESIGVKTDKRGMIEIADDFQTSIAGIYAIGDVVRGPMLAHKAEEEGVAVAELIAGHAAHLDYNSIPGIVYTSPEVAAVGQTEEQLKESGIAYKVGKFPFLANSRARSNDTADGFVKILADATTDQILGAHIIGHEAGTMIAEIVAVMAFGGSAEDIARTCHGHPTLNEAIKEAALAVDGRPIHI